MEKHAYRGLLPASLNTLSIGIEPTATEAKAELLFDLAERPGAMLGAPLELEQGDRVLILAEIVAGFEACSVMIVDCGGGNYAIKREDGTPLGRFQAAPAGAEPSPSELRAQLDKCRQALEAARHELDVALGSVGAALGIAP